MTDTSNLDADLARAVRRTGKLRQGFYLVVLGTALAGQVSGAVEALGIPLGFAVPAVGSLELGGVVVLANADVRRRLGEHATASRILSAGIAAGAVTFNWLAHSSHLLGGFFAGMSALGYLVWLMHSGNARRDRLRAKGDLPPTTPAYEVVGHWLRHPWLTRRAKSLAKANPALDLYGSLAAARTAVRTERRQAAISRVLRRKIAASADPTTAEIAVTVFDLDEVARRLARGADYDGLTALIAVDLNPARLLADQAPPEDALDVPKFLTEDRPAPTEVPAPTPHLPVGYFPWLRDSNGPIIGTPKPTEVSSGSTATSAPQVAPKRAATSRRKPAPKKRGKTAGSSGRRPTEETRKLAADLRTKFPSISNGELAQMLGITPTRLRQVEKPINGSKPSTT